MTTRHKKTFHRRRRRYRYQLKTASNRVAQFPRPRAAGAGAASPRQRRLWQPLPGRSSRAWRRQSRTDEWQFVRRRRRSGRVVRRALPPPSSVPRHRPDDLTALYQQTFIGQSINQTIILYQTSFTSLEI